MTYSSWQRADHVREIQEYLRTLALIDNNHLELAVDGIYGEETAEAVRAFQLANGLPVTGKVDSETWERLSADYLDALTLLTKAQSLQVFREPNAPLRPGDRGNTVYILQAMLNTIADALPAFKALTVNGEYDNATEARVREWQRLSGFPQTGIVDRYFWDNLANQYNNR